MILFEHQIFQMPATRKLKAEQKRSRNPDVMSDLENRDIMLGNFSRNELDCRSGERESGGEVESNGLLTVNPTSRYFK